ncbi:hypothetical protein ACFQVD_27940 [Streptosporangium amethystogenes subsp. fukuiense]|uniref:Lipoprotein n=1 Tax=Streptosporangium amethystogenes subsp. fukuiense TaxID=698418 RepID=A0ABW2T8W9_9ACTN
MRKTIWFLSLALLLSACGYNGMSPGEFQDRAGEVAERWHDSEEDRAWRTGFVPLEDLDIQPRERIPDWVPLSVHNGAWSLDVELPADTPPSRRMSWPDGSTLTVPLVTAATAYAERSKAADFIDEECPPGGCTPLRVTGAELGEVPLRTSRGTIQVPAWHFTVKGVKERFSRVAVHPSQISPRPARREGEHEEVMAFDLTPAKPRDLLLRYGHGSCDQIHGARAYETEDLVVVDVDEETSDRLCNLMLLTARITITLNKPLGNRLLLDSGTGLPVLPEKDAR